MLGEFFPLSQCLNEFFHNMLQEATKHIPNAKVTFFSGLLNEYCKQQQTPFIVRGLRAFSDFEYEFQRALLIKKIDHNLETVFIMTNAKYSFLSSSSIRELAVFGGDISGLVPECIEEKIKNHGWCRCHRLYCRIGRKFTFYAG